MAVHLRDVEDDLLDRLLGLAGLPWSYRAYEDAFVRNGRHHVGAADEPFTGNSLDGVGFLKLTRGGEILTRYEATASGLCRAGADVAAATALEDPELCFAGSPGFLDRHRVLAAVAYDIWPEESRHLLLDATSLEPLAEIAYPFAVSPEPVSLGDGTWITVRDDDVLRWRAR
ncbi:hypothetical protein ACFYYN_25530 [Streptomyces sp. NPDC001902]